MCNHRRAAVIILTLSALIMPVVGTGQTNIDAPKNKYSLSDDVRLGREAAAQVERQMPVLPEGSSVDNYVERVGRRLAEAIPAEFQHSEFQYQFDVVNARDINAFALPGGYMYVNRGMIEAARGEGEMAGVMAHEIAHVALRHGTAQASKASSLKFQLPAIGGAILGAIIGGGAGTAIAQGTQLGLGVYFLKYSREYERDADILGAQIMARSGYDPRDLANMFRTIEQRGGGGGPEWLSSHPNPGNRYERIMQEARLLRISPSEVTENTSEFNRIRGDLGGMGRAQSMEEIARNDRSRNRRYPEDARVQRRVGLPSSSYRTYDAGNRFRLSVPSNWRDFTESGSVTFAPEGAYGQYQGQSVFTHGIVAGVANAGRSNLREASDRYIGALLQGNPYLNQQSGYRRATIDGRDALVMTLAGRSAVTGRAERVTVYTAMLSSGELFYIVAVAPQGEYRNYDDAFENIVRSVRFRR